jgi:pimeloyl-ACP methyl ester carboxylesterase
MLFHGNGELIADYDAAAPTVADAGAALAVVDYRGYGKSLGEPTLRNVIQDSHKVVATLAERSVVVMGRSLGSVAAAELYRNPPPCVVGFIWESGIADVDTLVNGRNLRTTPPFSQEERDVIDPIPKLRAGRSPLLVIHGADDELVPPGEAQVAFDAAGTTNKELVLVPEKGHNDLSSAPIYWQAIAAFIQNRVADNPGTP